jgi:hypothetical protein
MIMASNPIRSKIFSPRNVLISSGAHPASYSIDCGDISSEVGSRSLKFTAHLHLLPRLGLSRTILLFPLYALIVCTRATWFVFGATDLSGPGPSHSPAFYIAQNDAPQSVRLLWTSDQLIAETCT